MEATDLVLSIVTIVLGVAIINRLSKYVNKIRDSKTFKSVIKESGYSEAILWYFTYFVKLGLYTITCLVAISFLGFAPQVLGLLAVIMAFSIIGVLTYSLRDVIPSMFAGAYIKHTKIIKKGDHIKIKDFNGIVKEVNYLTITLKDETGGTIIIPNKVVMERIIKKK